MTDIDAGLTDLVAQVMRLGNALEASESKVVELKKPSPR